MNAMTRNTLYTVVAVAMCATAQDNGAVERTAARERIAAIVRDALADGKANNPADRCWAVVQDANTGEIVCAEAIGGGTPWNEERFEIGQLVLPFLAAGALDAGVVQTNTLLDVSEQTIGGVEIRDFTRGRTEFTLAETIQWSSQRGGARLALALGAEGEAKTLDAFGLHFDQAKGTAEEQAVRTIRSGFGRDVTANWLEIASAFSALVNGGRLFRAEGPGAAVEAGNRPAASPATCRAVRTMLEGAVGPEGTARRAAVPGLGVAGKTSTFPIKKGDVYSQDYRAMFAGFFEANGRIWTVLVVFEIPESAKWKDAGVVAAPVFARIAADILGTSEGGTP